MSTAMTRTGPSAPMRWLASQGLIKGDALDYGCGKGFDASEYSMESYDTYYQPIMPDGRFDTITCIYVLNVIESDWQRTRVILDIRRRLKSGGTAYITVRNDKRALVGKTSRGYQCHVMLNLPVVRCCSNYVMYALRNDSINDYTMRVYTYEDKS